VFYTDWNFTARRIEKNNRKFFKVLKIEIEGGAFELARRSRGHHALQIVY
jgi:hypothetical protein